MFEITMLLKFSPKRDALFDKLKQEIAPATPGFCTLCPTRWTVRAVSLKSFLDNYMVLQALWEEVKDFVTDSEIHASVTGVDATMSKFSFLFGLVLAEKLLQHTDNLSKTLQASSLTASEGQEMANLTCTTLSRMRSTEAYDLFWERILQLQKEFGINEACLPHKRKAPRHLEVGKSTGYFRSTPKAFYSQQYFKCIHYIVLSHYIWTPKIFVPGKKISHIHVKNKRSHLPLHSQFALLKTATKTTSSSSSSAAAKTASAPLLCCCQDR